MIDAAIVPNYLEAIAGHMEDAICLGISVLTGPMIGGAIEVAAEIKKRVSEAPIIFGGWHPTLVAGGNPARAIRRYCRPRAG